MPLSSSFIPHPSSFGSAPSSFLAAIVLAAGHSSRMGSPKPFLEYKGRTFVETLVVNARSAGASSIVVVTHPAHGELYAEHRLDGCVLVENPDPDQGMLSSLKIGVRAIAPDVTHAIFCPVDCPAISQETWRLVAEACAHAPGRFVRPAFGGKPGHPAAIPVEFFDALLAWDAPGGARSFMDSMRGVLQEIAVGDAAILRDVDTPDDYAEIKDRQTE